MHRCNLTLIEHISWVQLCPASQLMTNKDLTAVLTTDQMQQTLWSPSNSRYSDCLVILTGFHARAPTIPALSAFAVFQRIWINPPLRWRSFLAFAEPSDGWEMKQKPEESPWSHWWTVSCVPSSIPMWKPSDPTHRKGPNPYRGHEKKSRTFTRVCFVTIMEFGKSIRVPEVLQLAIHFSVLTDRCGRLKAWLISSCH